MTSAQIRGSLWLDLPHEDDEHDYERREFPTSIVDVVIVGGGMVGASLAYLLAQSDLSVVLCEARTVGASTTGNSTGKATMFQGVEFARLIDEIGIGQARLVIDGDRAALDLIRSWGEALPASGGATVATHWAYSTDDSGVGTLRREAKAAQALGVSTHWLDATETTVGNLGLGVDEQVLVEPVRLCRALTKAASANGVTILEHARVTSVGSDDVIEVGLADGRCIRARKVVLATQVPIVDRSLVFAACEFRRSHVVAIDAPDAFDQLPAMYTGVDEGGLSLRPARRADGSTVVVVAGHGHALDVDEDGTHVEGLVAHARKLLAGTIKLGHVSHSWLAHDAFPADGRPFVGAAHGSRNVLIATGFGGWGLARGVSAAMAIVELIHRGHASWEHPFDARRLGAFASATTVKGGVKTVAAFVGDRLGARTLGDVDNIAPGKGRIVRDGLRTVAVARDREGDLHAVDAACTHLGCIVHHDDERGEWQCPCHGSRFSLEGDVLAGPATRPLERHDL